MRIKVDDRVCVHGTGFGKVILIKPEHYPHDRRGRQVQVQFDDGRKEWHAELHISKNA